MDTTTLRQQILTAYLQNPTEAEFSRMLGRLMAIEPDVFHKAQQVIDTHPYDA